MLDNIAAEKTRLLPILQAITASRWTSRGMPPGGPFDHSKVGKARKR